MAARDPAKETDKFTVRDFRTDCLRELKKIKDAWPDPHYASYLARAAGGPMPTAVRTQSRELAHPRRFALGVHGEHFF